MSVCLCMACLKRCSHSFTPLPALPSLEGVSSWPALRQPSGTATPPHLRQHKTSVPVKQSGNTHPQKYFKPAPGEGGSPVQPPFTTQCPEPCTSAPNPLKLRFFIERQMLRRDVLGLFTTTARAAAQQQPRGSCPIRHTNELVRINCSPSYCRSSAYVHLHYKT